MALTLTSNISAHVQRLQVTGTVPDDIAAGYTFRLDDELMTLVAFHSVRRVVDRNDWMVGRGTGEFVPAAHTAGATIKGARDGFVNGSDQDEPDPFASGGGGLTNPLTQDLDAGGNRITNAADGVDPSDVATVGQLGGGGGIASPLAIDGCVLWLDASDATTINAGSPSDDDPVTAWADKSPSGYIAVTATQDAAPMAGPTFVESARNGLSVLRFDPSAAEDVSGVTALDITNGLGLLRDIPGCTVVVMAGRHEAFTWYDVPLFVSINGDAIKPRLIAGRCGFNFVNPADVAVSWSQVKLPTDPPDTPSLVFPFMDVDNGIQPGRGVGTFLSGWSAWAIRVDAIDGGAVQVQGGAAALSPTWNWKRQAWTGFADADSALVRVGASGDAWNEAGAVDGDIGELIVYGRVLNSVELRQVFDYLSVKWATL